MDAIPKVWQRKGGKEQGWMGRQRVSVMRLVGEDGAVLVSTLYLYDFRHLDLPC